jgi:WD40 repeat protein
VSPLAEAVLQVNTEALAGPAAREHEARLTELEQLCEDALELSFSALAHGVEPPPYDVRCPFPGLRAFTAEQREYFRGREVLVETLLRRLERQPFLAVLGNSGCGKSSVVMAGLIPRLRDVEPELKVVQLEPGDHPLGKLKAVLGQLEGAAKALIYVDQLEEAFTLCRDEGERKAFFDHLLGAVGPRRRVIVSMRADFIGDCVEHEGLREQMEVPKLIPPMSADELRNAIEEQGRAAGLRYETGLCELILGDVKNEPGAMPLLQHALRELYNRRHGRWLRVKAYDELGRVHRAISNTADSVWSRLDEPDRERLRNVLLELAEARKVEGGERVRYLRRRVPLDQLHAATPSEAAEIERLVDLLANERLLVKSLDDELGAVVEVAHEALLRVWDKLQDWLTMALGTIWLRQELEAAETRWRNNARNPEFLDHVHARGEPVRSLLSLGRLKLGPRLQEYFTACEAEEQRQRSEEERRLRELVAQRDRARDATWMAYARTFADKDPTRALLGLREVGSKTTPGWYQQALDILQRPIARAVFRDVEWARLSPDGRRVVTVWGSTVHVRSADGSGEPVVLRHDDVVRSARFDPAAERVVTASGKMAWVWKADGSGEPVVLRHDDVVRSARFDPAGERVVTASGKVARVWKADGSGKPVVLRGHEAGFRDSPLDSRRTRRKKPITRREGGIHSARFSPDGRQVVTASDDKTARVWYAGGYGKPLVLRGHDGAVHSAMFSPDGRHVLTVSQDMTALVWNVDGSGKPMEITGGDTPDVIAARFGPDGKSVVVVSGDKTPWLWQEGRGRGNPRLSTGHDKAVRSARFSPDWKSILTASDDKTARICEASGDDGVLVILRGHEGAVLSASYSLDGQLVVTVSDDATARVWNVAGGVPVVLRGHVGGIRAVSFSPDGSRVVTASDDATARLWNADGSGEPLILRGHMGAVSSASFGADGARVVTASRDGTSRVWNADGSGDPVVLRGHGGGVNSALLALDGQRVVTASTDRTAQVWNVDGLGEPVVLRGHENDVRSAILSSDGTRVVTASEDGTARVWNVDGSGEPVVLRGHTEDVRTAMFRLDGMRIVTASEDHTVRVWNVDGRGEPVVLRGHAGSVRSASFSADGRRVISASWDRTARIWSADGSGEPVVLRGHDNWVVSASFSHDGTRVVTASEDGTARVWNADGSGVPIILSGHTAAVRAASFSPDGKHVATASMDGTVRVWPVDASLVEALLEAGSSACVSEQDRCQYLGESTEEARRAFSACERKHGRLGTAEPP